VSASHALEWASNRVNKVVESPPGSNKGPGQDGITQWEIDSGYPWVKNAAVGVPWCQCFANAVAVHGGCKQITTGFTPDVMNGFGDYRPIHVDDAQPGDFIYFKWPGVSHDPSDHVGVLVSKTSTTVTCIEGNTSAGAAGSQNNGGGVYKRTRSRTLVVGAVRVPYPQEAAYRNLTLGMTGRDVSALQESINDRADGCGRKDRRVTVDGTYGTETKQNGAWAAYILGIGSSQADNVSGGMSSNIQNLIRNPEKRNAVEKERAADRRHEYCR
jgi:hypothetical protein